MTKRSTLCLTSQIFKEVFQLPENVVVTGAEYEPELDVIHIHLSGIGNDTNEGDAQTKYALNDLLTQFVLNHSSK